MDADEARRNDLAAKWLDYVLRWAERCEDRHGDPVGLYANAAIEGLLAAIRTNTRGRETLSKNHLNACLWSAGRDATKTERRRASKHGRDVLDIDHPGRELSPIDQAIYNEELMRHGYTLLP